MMVECPKCHGENRYDSKFCSNCAAPLGPGAGAGPEAASLTKTLETPIRVLGLVDDPHPAPVYLVDDPVFPGDETILR